jgi:hypothetical protein
VIAGYPVHLSSEVIDTLAAMEKRDFLWNVCDEKVALK